MGIHAQQSYVSLVHINTTTFSAVSSVSVDDCFSATYNNYLIVTNSTTSSAAPLSFRLRLSGTDASGVTDYATGWNITTSGGAFDGSSAASSGTSSGYILQHSFAGNSLAQSQISSPFIATPTFCLSTITMGSSSRTDGGTSYTQHKLSTSYDGFTLFPSSGTITGTLRIYGYKNGA